ncbi:hypothetical protein GN244_ATG13541 [Phytophthora infestans]|uniref:VHS domain-containing protein n=1 Tax=Phytophthora infestans TaxID=4787 RepID=A0A833SP15_PHYIN|nr:hypothetical protein GN244_ATG13541 [Phytophthora infestans]KAF4149627.1 hypothetical protein GN958_ATG01211 [Phytophthora infestans]
MNPDRDENVVGIQALNSENEATRFDEALNGYFRVSSVTHNRPRGRGGRRKRPQSAENDPEKCLKQLKRILRDAEAPVQSQYIRRLHAAILHQLKRAKTSPTVFSRAVQLCQEIFKRSTVLRALIATQTSSFFGQLLLAAGEDPNGNVSKALRARNRDSQQLTMVLGLIETWKQDFGDRYPSIVAAYNVLEGKGYRFPHERERQQEVREREVNTRRHRERVRNAKKQQRDREMKRYVPEMEQVLVEMNRVFEILVPTLDAFHMEDDTEEKPTLASSTVNMPLSTEHSNERGNAEESGNDDTLWATAPVDAEEQEDVEWESVGEEGDDAFEDDTSEGEVAEDGMDINDIVQAYGLGSSSYQLTIEVSKQVCEESSENDALYRTLADGALRIRKRFKPLLDDWEQHSTLEVQAPSDFLNLQPQREVLQRINDLRDRMTHTLLKWDDLVHDSKKSKRDDAIQSAVVSVPLDSYNLPIKRKRRA